MDFIPDTTDYVPAFIALGIALVLCIALGFIYTKSSEEPGDATITVNVVLAFAAAVSFIVFIVLFFWNMGQHTIRQEDVVTQIQETYGVFPSDRDVKNLDYPDERPDGRFTEFGSFQRDNGEEAVLVWKTDELQLGTMDGGRFTEFDRVDG